MINLMIMNFCRLLKTKSFYITILIAFTVFFFLSTIETDPAEKEFDKAIAEQEGISADSEGTGMTLGEDITETSHIEDIYRSIVGSGLLLMIIGISSAGFSSEERNSGFLKNLTVGSREKKYIFISNIPVILLYSLVLLGSAFLGVKLACLFRGNPVYTVESAAGLLFYFILEVLLHTAYGVFTMAIYEAGRKLIVSVMVAIFGSMGIFSFIFGMAESRIASAGGVIGNMVGNIGLSQLMIVTNARGLEVTPKLMPYWGPFAVALVGIVVYLIIGATVFTKRDTY